MIGTLPDSMLLIIAQTVVRELLSSTGGSSIPERQVVQWGETIKAGMRNGMEYGMEHGTEYGMEYGMRKR